MQPNKQSNYFLNGLFIVLISTVALIYYYQAKQSTSDTVDKVVNGESRLDEISIKGVPLPPQFFASIKPEIKNIIDSFPKKKDVTFPSGKKISVTYRLRDKDYLPELSSTNLENYINQLLTLAENNNGAAAYEAFRQLYNCRQAPRSPEDYYSRITALATTDRARTGDGLGGRSQIEPGSDEYQNLVYGLRMGYYTCKSISDELIRNREVWLERAIELNSHEALISRDFFTGRYGPINESQFYKRAWDAGYILAGELRSPSDVSRHAYGLEPDPIRTYAYSLAKITVLEAYLKQSNLLNADYLISQIKNNYAGDYISPKDIFEAEKLAIELIQNNENCCKGPWLRFELGDRFFGR